MGTKVYKTDLKIFKYISFFLRNVSDNKFVYMYIVLNFTFFLSLNINTKCIRLFCKYQKILSRGLNNYIYIFSLENI